MSGAERAATSIGRALFFGTDLSMERSLSCVTCHQPEAAWRDGRGTSPDRAGTALPRKSLSVVNLAWAPVLAWDGRSATLEIHSLDPVLNPRIGGLDRPAIVARVTERLAADEPLRAAFQQAFGDDRVTPDRVAASLAAFQRSIVSPVSPFDRWVEGDDAALNADAQRGFQLFTGRARCAVCHSSWRLTDDGFHDVGLPDADLGRGRLFPDEPTLQHTFKTPTLRGISVKGPFMHDGSLPDLDSVLSHYDTGFSKRPSLDPDVRPLALSAQERADLTAFLLSLSPGR